MSILSQIFLVGYLLEVILAWESSKESTTLEIYHYFNLSLPTVAMKSLDKWLKRCVNKRKHSCDAVLKFRATTITKAPSVQTLVVPIKLEGSFDHKECLRTQILVCSDIPPSLGDIPEADHNADIISVF